MKIAIIGGSIAGCALALLIKDKFDVTVFERSKDLSARGAGITMSKELFQSLISKDIIDQDTINYSCSTRSLYCQSPGKPDYGHCLWHQDISILSLHWDTLFQNLRKRIPDEIYKNGYNIIDVILNDKGSNHLVFESGKMEAFDLIIFADGSQSLGRKLISENSQLSYSGYVAWRGLINFDSIKDKSPFIDNIPYYCFNKGHLLAYPVDHDGVKKLNWVFYEKIPLEDLEHLGTTTQKDFSETATVHLHQLAKSKLPKTIAELVIQTECPFMQKIVDVGVERLISKRALLLGDASIVLRPHVGSGASLAIQDSLNLSEHLCSNKGIEQAIGAWEEATLASRLATYALSKRMGDALVLAPVSWQEMDKNKMDAWWEKIILGDKWYTTKNLDPQYSTLQPS